MNLDNLQLMKSVLFTSKITKWSFALAAAIASYFGLPDAQREYLKDRVKSKIVSYFKLNENHNNVELVERFLPDLSHESVETVYYFNKITRYSEKRPFHKGPIIRWDQDINNYLAGTISKSNKKEIIKVIIELNRLIKPIKINLVQKPERANSFVYFGSLKGFNSSIYTEKKLTNDYLGHFHIKTFQQEIQKSTIYINTAKATLKRQKHIIREELTQSLGLINDAYDYPNSIFYQGYSETKGFTEMDKALIQLLYGN